MAGNRVLLWRHGQTDWNMVNRFQGHSDIPLNNVGRYQVQHAAEILAGMNPTAIISSDLGRAQETAQALAKLVGLSVTTHEGLRETNGGLWEGKTGKENRAEDFQNFIRWIDGEDNPAGTTGEKRSEVATRAVAVISEALAGKSDQLLIVATHGGTARCVLGNLLQLPLSHWGVIGGLSNAAWSILERNPRQWNLIEHNAGSIPEPVYGEESGATSA
ncbi:MAG: histidine phosphatase family protein [Streptomycetaceae bacterium]|jgi:broad specificity phosphatase PhoE|nr:MAG: histidine phosphatase family protein [Streptomycetaceae bacterium]